ncbi:MAG: beta-propeller fold lactonase family protein [Planctomycetota bacterium]
MRLPLRSTTLALCVAASACGGGSSGAGSADAAGGSSTGGFVPFESTPTHPIAVSHDGERLFVANAIGGRLSVFDLSDPATPVLVDEIPVGLEPVSLAERTPGEVWVANQLSDNVSVVDVDAGRVDAIVPVGDQPSDVAFAAGRAFVTAATEDRVLVFDGGTRAPLGEVTIEADEPRALAVANGRVWALARRSGNRTTILPAADAPPPPLPTDPALPPAPKTSLIVRIDDPAWSADFSYTLPDHDLFAIDPLALVVDQRVSGVATTHFDLLHDPVTDRLLVAGTDARNVERFEPTLRGRAVESRVVAVDAVFGAIDAVVDLNAHLSGVLPDPVGAADALAEPTGLALDPLTRELFVAAQGSDRIGVLDVDSGAVLARIELGAPADTTRDRRGPRALALHPSGRWLYVYNRLSDSLSVVDTALRVVVLEVPIAADDPMPLALREGRKFLYDARLSGNGTQSCALCHVDGETDGLAWDLGDPGGELFTVPFELQQPKDGALPGSFPDLHPMKGPMVTQSLRGLGAPLHWRGDKLTFEDFNGAFDSLLGGSEIPAAQMQAFGDWARAVVHPPNPHQPLDRSLETLPLEANPAMGQALFEVTQPTGQVCIDCHTGPATTNSMVVEINANVPQPARTAPLLDYYRKDGFDPDSTGELKVGFGRFGDGRVGYLVELAPTLPLFTPEKGGSPHIDAFLRQIDTGTPPATGVQTLLDGATVNDSQSAALRALLLERAALEEVELVAHGVVEGSTLAWLYDAEVELWRTADPTLAALQSAELEAFALAGLAELVWTAVPFGEGARFSAPHQE